MDSASSRLKDNNVFLLLVKNISRLISKSTLKPNYFFWFFYRSKILQNSFSRSTLVYQIKMQVQINVYGLVEIMSVGSWSF